MCIFEKNVQQIRYIAEESLLDAGCVYLGYICVETHDFTLLTDM